MKLEELSKQLVGAHHKLMNATHQYRLDASATKRFEAELKSIVATSIMEGVITGKNQAERDAVEQKLFAGQYKQLEELKEVESFSYLKLETAKIAVQMWMALLRIEELTRDNS